MKIKKIPIKKIMNKSFYWIIKLPLTLIKKAIKIKYLNNNEFLFNYQLFLFLSRETLFF